MVLCAAQENGTLWATTFNPAMYVKPQTMGNAIGPGEQAPGSWEKKGCALLSLACHSICSPTVFHFQADLCQSHCTELSLVYEAATY